eukprot:scaffold2329_cov247-Pinguiococcus_pyrenoidosus.AAC.13
MAWIEFAHAFLCNPSIFAAPSSFGNCLGEERESAWSSKGKRPGGGRTERREGPPCTYRAPSGRTFAAASLIARPPASYSCAYRRSVEWQKEVRSAPEPRGE